MEKRGELTSAQIITLVLAIAGTIIVIIFLALIFEDRGEVDREACRISVLTRATAPTVAQAAIPLKCQTEKICLSESGKNDACSQFLGEKNVRDVRLQGDDNQKRVQMERELAEAMYFCWSMMGQGKLDIVGNARLVLLGSKAESCVICSRVAFSEDIPEELVISVNMEDYMENNAVPGGSLTYLETFTDRGTKTFGSVSEGINLEKNDDLSVNVRDDRQISLVFSQVRSADIGNVLTNVGYAAAAGTFAIPGAAKAGSALFLSKAAIVTVPLVAVGLGGVSLNTWLGQQAAAGYCGDFSSAAQNEDLRRGCSVIQALPYNVEYINAMCETIEGSP